MSATEDYLDKLLRGVTGEPDPEPEPEPEPEDIGDLLADSESDSTNESTYVQDVLFSEPVNTDLQNILSDLPNIDDESEGELSIDDLIPKQIISEMPVLADDAEPAEVPVMVDSNITIDNNFVSAEPSVFEEAPVTEQLPIMEEVPVTEDIPMMEELPMVEEFPAMEEAPVIEDIQNSDVEEVPAAIEEPIFADDSVPMESTLVLDESMTIDDILEADLAAQEMLATEMPVAEMTGEEAPVSEVPADEPLVADIPEITEVPVDEVIAAEVALDEAPEAELFADSENSTDNEMNIEPDVSLDESSIEGLLDMGDEFNLDDLPALDDEPVIDESTHEEPMIEESLPESTSVEEPILDELIPEENIVEDAISEESALEEPSLDDLLSETPASEEPSLDDLLGEVSAAEEPILEESVPDAPSLDMGLNSDNLEDDEIANLLMDIENMGREDALNDLMSSKVDESLDSLLSDSGDADMSEIGDILARDESNELLDDFSMSSGMDLDEDIMSGGFLSDDDSEEESGKKKKKEKKKKEKKPKKEKKAKKDDDSEKKPGFLKKILDLLIADDEEDIDENIVFEETAVDIAVEGAVENEAILAELEEDGGKKKGKKGKKAKLTDKEKAELKAEKQRQKEEKKRLKAEAKALEDAKPKKKLSKKKVIPICILCFSLGVAITLLAFVMPSLRDRKKAVKMYQQHNYEATYGLLKGHSLNKSEQLMYDRTVTLLQEERKLDSYHNYMILDMKPEALNALVQGVKKYDEVSAKASELDVTDELNSIYSQIVSELQASFGITVDKVYQWLNINDPEEYSYIINSYANGRGDSLIDTMETEDGIIIDNSTVNVWDNSVISAEEAEIQ